MGRKPKLYVPLTVTFLEDDRIIEVGDGSTLLYIAMCLRAKSMGSDGRLTESQIGRLHRPRWKTELQRLADVGLVLFDESTREWFVAGWFSHNEPIAAVDARRAADRDRKAGVSDRNPHGFPPDSSPKGSKGREGKESNPRGNLHRYADSGDGACSECHLPSSNSLHLRSVTEAS
jgi:hypothetical protein